MVSIYVDNFLLILNYFITLDIQKKKLGQKYSIKDLKEVQTIIGWQITEESAACILKIDQIAFIWDLVTEEDLNKYNANIIPIKTSLSLKIFKSDNYEKIEFHLYLYLIDKWIYFTCGIGPDIAFVVGQFSKYNSNPRKSHLQVAKRVVQYLKRIIQLGLVYGQKPERAIPRNLFPYDLIRYVKSNFAGYLEDRKFVMGYYFFFNRAVVLWSSKKQRIVSISTTKAEYIALEYAARKVVYIWCFINKLKPDIILEIKLFRDNKMNITLTKNAESQHQIKHINVQHYYIRELINEKALIMK